MTALRFKIEGKGPSDIPSIPSGDIKTQTQNYMNK